MIASIADVIWAVVSATPVEFCVGAAVGFLLSNRWRLIRRDGKDDST